jgi:hypothetical protein
VSVTPLSSRATGAGLLGAALLGGSLAAAFADGALAPPAPLPDERHVERFHAEERAWRAAEPTAGAWRAPRARDDGRIRRGDASPWGAGTADTGSASGGREFQLESTGTADLIRWRF